MLPVIHPNPDPDTLADLKEFRSEYLVVGRGLLEHINDETRPSKALKLNDLLRICDSLEMFSKFSVIVKRLKPMKTFGKKTLASFNKLISSNLTSK